ncbi:hypothetical protein LMG19083_01904 [Ralstonia psammae]|uniref:Transmembrane protein n=1 Tax=Ralstonia psammae TaxID=3058598 RepID=A0ABM9JD02_9RALS|nr:hypothetical protein [Ralstonia sp. LMG 19083]CAJ0789691.1 hypothetical protein LMG19083_01904 [Ralstonia sp. LMG 19083]
MSQDLKARLGGVLVLILGAVIGWIFILGPLHQAQAGAATVCYSLKAMVLVPGCVVFGLAFLVGGDKLAYRDAQRKRLTPLGWVLIAFFAAASAFCYWWFKQQFAALGYAS